MSPVLLKSLLLSILLIAILQKSDGQTEPQWCIADEQTPDADLQQSLDWACGKGGADCSKIQENQTCYLPNTIKDHASFAFNSYWQKFKNQGGVCYFHGASMITELDPSKTFPPTCL